MTEFRPKLGEGTPVFLPFNVSDLGFELSPSPRFIQMLWYGPPDNAIGYRMHSNRSHDAVIHVYDDTGKVIEVHRPGPPRDIPIRANRPPPRPKNTADTFLAFFI